MHYFKNLYKKISKLKINFEILGFYPTTSIMNFLVGRILMDEIKKVIPLYAKGNLLDIGCGNKPLKNFLHSYVKEHVGVDCPETLHNKSAVDLWGDACNLPVSDQSFDTVLCMAVLEHLEEPDKAIKEASRVIKKGGYAIYMVPLYWHLHEEPRDFYRFTKYGSKYLFEKNGFKIIELKELSGFLVTFGQELVYYLYRFRKGGKLNPLWWIIPFCGILIQTACYFLNKIDKSKRFTYGYLLVARKL